MKNSFKIKIVERKNRHKTLKYGNYTYFIYAVFEGYKLSTHINSDDLLDKDLIKAMLQFFNNDLDSFYSFINDYILDVKKEKLNTNLIVTDNEELKAIFKWIKEQESNFNKKMI